jgi:hypothetical protein
MPVDFTFSPDSSLAPHAEQARGIVMGRLV